MYAWRDTTAESTTVPSGATKITPEASPITITSSITAGTYIQTENMYVHVKVIDSVGNVGYAHAKFGYDSVAPATPTVTFTAAAYSTTSATINIASSDATSGLAYMRVAGDISNPTTTDS
jgi:hypothetical protein